MPTSTTTTTSTNASGTTTQTATVTAPDPPAPAGGASIFSSSNIPGDPLGLIDPSLVGMSAERLARLEGLVKQMVDSEFIPFGRLKVH